VLWVRHLLRDLAAEGRTVLVSSHLMSEMAVTADRLVVIGRGRLLADTTVQELITAAADDAVIVRSPQTSRLRELLVGPDVSVTGSADELTVTGLTAEQVGERAAAAGVVLHQLSSQTASLEEAFMKMTGDSVEFHGRATPHVDEPTAAGTASHRKAS
jgi:ABC-2 type transport system ATP-binding protein